jgi:hypothetical protein
MLLQYKYLSLLSLYILFITFAIFCCGKTKKDYGQNEYRFLLTDFHNFRCTGKGGRAHKVPPFWSSSGHLCSGFIAVIVKGFDRSHVLAQPLPCRLPPEKSVVNTSYRSWLEMKKTYRTNFTRSNLFFLQVYHLRCVFMQIRVGRSVKNTTV